MEVADLVGAKIDYQVCNVLEIDMNTYYHSFDVVFMEGDVLHCLRNIDEFMAVMNLLLKPNGKMICSDFPPLYPNCG